MCRTFFFRSPKLSVTSIIAGAAPPEGGPVLPADAAGGDVKFEAPRTALGACSLPGRAVSGFPSSSCEPAPSFGSASAGASATPFGGKSLASFAWRPVASTGSSSLGSASSSPQSQLGQDSCSRPLLLCSSLLLQSSPLASPSGGSFWPLSSSPPLLAASCSSSSRSSLSLLRCGGADFSEDGARWRRRFLLPSLLAEAGDPSRGSSARRGSPKTGRLDPVPLLALPAQRCCTGAGAVRPL
mmetsp:Transcript_29859/g.68819  ORF Transcript_29859/g.68819 Transcript_29859/m.68819 type:complete len:241 (-) Transcript_29859:138-860(-)